MFETSHDGSTGSSPVAGAASIIAQYFGGRQLAEFIYVVYDWWSRFKKLVIIISHNK